MSDDEPEPWKINIKVNLHPLGCLFWVLLLCIGIGLIGDALRALP